MDNEQRPLRRLKGFERLLIRLGRCPSCHKKLVPMPQEKIEAWHGNPAGLGKGYAGQTGIGASRMMRGNIIKLSHQKIPHCPSCQHTFIHGWVYPAAE